MSNEAYVVAAIVAVLLPTLYFLIASPTFLLAKFEDPVVTWLLRGLFSVHFRLICIGSGVAVVTLILAGHPIFALVPAAIAGLAIVMRKWILRRMDDELSARDAGDGCAIPRMKRLYRRAMAYNAVQFAILVASIPLTLPTP